MSQPKALVIVAWLFIVSGAISVVGMVGTLLIGHRVNVDLTVVDLWIGLGLLRGAPRWRWWAVFTLWLGVVLLPIISVLLLFAPRSLELRLFGLPIGSVPKEIAFVAVVVALAGGIWQYRVLQRPEVLAVFEPPIVDGAGISSP